MAKKPRFVPTLFTPVIVYTELAVLVVPPKVKYEVLIAVVVLCATAVGVPETEDGRPRLMVPADIVADPKAACQYSVELSVSPEPEPPEGALNPVTVIVPPVPMVGFTNENG